MRLDPGTIVSMLTVIFVRCNKFSCSKLSISKNYANISFFNLSLNVHVIAGFVV